MNPAMVGNLHFNPLFFSNGPVLMIIFIYVMQLKAIWQIVEAFIIIAAAVRDGTCRAEVRSYHLQPNFLSADS
jgi:hypothetical protein